jgi:hypothetical protein
VPLSLNLGTLTSWNTLGQSRPLTGLLYLYIFTFNISIIFQLKGDTLDDAKVLEEVKDMIQLAKKNGKEVDENQLKAAMSNCGNQGKYYCTLGIFSCFNF